ncbi:hypothetical protein HYH03_017631 [Edaphochlamys debaryana]|uniref:RWD domain-containing protein n=1 Tax=Edaphochlamys debaryana TaxID=47281 RepID=A0A835XHI4_9CHLO|nr:hypothetical protein HYH03_017631 [Edaphochlamys debaryana]|eukprot:KAG2483524.1 hypothetical protein HYH03_017631 [Edaphochlamys debaryana]
MADADATAREEELEAVEAIFGEAVNVSRDELLLEVCVQHPQGGPQEVVMRASLPASYPSTSPPVAEVYGNHLSDDVRAWAVRELEKMWSPGEVCLYNWVEWLKEAELLWNAPTAPGPSGRGARKQEEGEGEGGEGTGPAASRRAAGVKEAAREAEALELLRQLRVTSGEPYVEKKSTFQAHVAPVSSFEEVTLVMDALLSISKIRAATHNIMAYRIAMPGGAFVQDCDDDGEVAAGGRLLHFLQAGDVRNCVVVVSRWFGGVLLGPARFAIIINTARHLLEQMGLVGGGGGKGEKGDKGHGGKKAGR